MAGIVAAGALLAVGSPGGAAPRVPKGWKLVGYGEAGVFVPQSWRVKFGPSDAGGTTPVVVVGSETPGTTGLLTTAPQVFTVQPFGQAFQIRHDVKRHLVNGIAVYEREGPPTKEKRLRWGVPSLGVDLTGYGSLARSIAGTLVRLPSPARSGYREIGFGTAGVSVPEGWHVDLRTACPSRSSGTVMVDASPPATCHGPFENLVVLKKYPFPTQGNAQASVSTVHGVPVDVVEGLTTRTQIQWRVPSLGLELTAFGPQAHAVAATLRHLPYPSSARTTG